MTYLEWFGHENWTQKLVPILSRGAAWQHEEIRWFHPPLLERSWPVSEDDRRSGGVRLVRP